ncbi:MAG: tyrosine--tRNA ligase [Verrucomicrobia bacterium]|nr:tyrosine--tRNA ligase [Verrucomicrobiota bacterium]
MSPESLLSGLTHVHTREEFAKKIASGRPLRVKLGFDPSAPDLHLGHALVLAKVRQFQEAGHLAVIIVGDYTARVGDPTGRSKTRPALEPEVIEQNAKTYTDQVFKIIDPKKTEVRRNGEWLAKLSCADLLRLNGQVNVARMLERDDFSKRHKEGIPISLAEFQYPVLQGYDSVAVKSDIELGGNDQLFNNLVGRDLQRQAGQEPQVVLVTALLTGTDGKQKMSKSLNNHIGITEPPTEIFGKVMSIPDETCALWRDLLGSFLGLPKEKFSKKDLTTAEMNSFRPSSATLSVAKLIQETKALPSNSEARRLITQGGVKLDGAKLDDPQAEISLKSGQVLQVGKKTFLRITL